jgi:hypothetical protein
MPALPSVLLTAALLALTGQVAQQTPQAQRPAATPAAVAAGAAACRGLPSDQAAAGRLLVQRGWTQTAARAADGTSPPIFGRDNVAIMLIVSTSNGRTHALCNILGGVAANVTIAQLAAAISAAVGAQPRETQNNEAAWDLGERGAVLLTLLPGPPQSANLYVMPRAMAVQ